MKRLFLVVLLLALTGTSQAIDIKGKWGLGVGIGSATPAEPYLIRGKTTRTAWILDGTFDQRYSEARDTTGYNSFTRSVWLGFGPRLRRFTRPQEKLSPYWDVSVHLNGQRSSYSGTQYGYRYYSEVRYSAGFSTGLEGGVEYFTPWHFSLAAHTPFFLARLDRHWSKSEGRISLREWLASMDLTISPRLHVRVYF